jgi:predicted N-acetyltransferase YhbS
MPMSEEERKRLARERVEALKQEADKQIGRWVAAGTALLAPVIAVVCAWLQDKIGINLDPEEVTGLITATVIGVTTSGATWLYNRGGFERKAEDVYAIYLRGEEIQQDIGG